MFITIAGRVIELAQLSNGMHKAALAWLKREAVKEFFATATAAGLPPDYVREKLDELGRDENVRTGGLDHIAYTLWQRAGVAAMTLEEARGITAEELLLNRDAIMEADLSRLSDADKKKVAEIVGEIAAAWAARLDPEEARSAGGEAGSGSKT
jgi:hypothetical protein